ncbi:MAG TPA: hypothetical protein DDW33_14170 [Ktedonobacter sp.]|jgi:excisionase family DNA binding protein|nr:hypothetical protein [Ktedonobacter sp.]HBE26818.1 hypothetical protein [Ktedonobacter sp.]HCF85834.1 hypothetical protein [Ktedonobacter sp.]HCP75759.1 hypothetical protein [Ktedonobacter sp.]
MITPSLAVAPPVEPIEEVEEVRILRTPPSHEPKPKREQKREPKPEREPEDGWLTPQEVAALLQVSLRLVQQLIRAGDLPSSYIGTMRCVRMAGLRTYMAARRTPSQ